MLLRVYDALGRKVATLVDDYKPAVFMWRRCMQRLYQGFIFIGLQQKSIQKQKK